MRCFGFLPHPGEFVILGIDVRGDKMIAASGTWRPDLWQRDYLTLNYGLLNQG